jgi:hypothetical protein
MRGGVLWRTVDAGEKESRSIQWSMEFDCAKLRALVHHNESRSTHNTHTPCRANLSTSEGDIAIA